MSKQQRETRLTKAHRKVASAVRTLEAAKGELNRAILDAVSPVDSAGKPKVPMTAGQLAGELGVSRSRAWEMIRQADGRGRSGS